MRMSVTTVLGTQARAMAVASSLNAVAREVPGAHPQRIYTVEPTRLPFAHRVVKYTEGLSEACR